jgi:hypothetical protein
MSNNFDWQTEDDRAWEVEENGQPVMRQSRSLPWRTLSIFVVLMVIAGLVAYWQFSRRLETLTAVIETDVLSSHNLLNRAVAQEDLELLAPLLSARDLAWTNAQEKLLESGLFYGRAPLGLPLAEATPDHPELSTADSRYVNIEISPDMNTAELHFLQPYAVAEETVMLEQTAVYRRGRNRWLLSPPDETFWGEWQTSKTAPATSGFTAADVPVETGEWQASETTSLTLVYPARDAAVAEKLVVDLTAVLREACRRFDCPTNYQFHIRLETDPDSLLALSDPTNLYDGNTRLSLPAPTLVGLPVDDAGYEALKRGYAASLTAVLIAHLTNWQCCDHAPIFQAFLDYQLSEMGLRAWPVTGETHSRLINSGVNTAALFPFFQDSSLERLHSPDGWLIYAFVDFLMHQQTDMDALDILADLNEAQSFQQWLASLFGYYQDEMIVLTDRLSRIWWLYAHTQVAASQGPPPIPFPEQDIQLTCADPFAVPITTTLYRYLPGQDEWQTEQVWDGQMFVNPLSKDEGVLLQTINAVEDELQSQIWQEGEGIQPGNGAYPFTLSWGQADPMGRYLLLYTNQTDMAALQPLLVDLPSCEGGSCIVTLLDGLPIWSPDGSQSVVAMTNFLENGLLPTSDGRVILFTDAVQLQDVSLFRANATADAASQIPIGEGNLPFWVTSQTYGYVRNANPATPETAQEVVLAAVSDDVPQVVLSTDDLLAALPEGARPLRLSIRYVLAHPKDNGLLIIMAASRTENYIFLVDLKNERVENRLTLAPDGYHFFGFSPDGRYFITTGRPESNLTVPQEVTAYYLHDIARNRTQTFMAGSSLYLPAYAFDWSADGNWLALILNNGAISLIAPQFGYQHIILHEVGNCSSLAWVNPAQP